ncbi:hypothetical protein GO755_33645 [Spirosoma sp. HMF4905]|uniref:Uncharacterized protein n=1 Tax=Spirosoma arboris TaxID=2682092 RepID=A0A7K1SMJ4_9BACT|nr:hypothetical protein [Spirosoma arboris]MVM35019.1 hypothetical protein [Spirosoma arboris]
MDHRLIFIGKAVVLLDRLELLEPELGWQVITSTYVTIKKRYDEWINFSDPEQARAYIKGFSKELAQQFLERAHRWPFPGPFVAAPAATA